MPEQMIYTSYFGKLKKLPSEIVPISICRKAPERYEGIQYEKLAPKIGFLMEWKKNHNNQYYIEHFYNEVLENLNPAYVVDELYHLSGGKQYALICYEKPDNFCHRHLVAEWLKNAGYKAKEYVELPEKEKLVKE